MAETEYQVNAVSRDRSQRRDICATPFENIARRSYERVAAELGTDWTVTLQKRETTPWEVLASNSGE